MKLYYVANARMPNEKAHGIQIAKTCESFITAGVDVTLLVPSRTSGVSVQDFYHLRVPVPTVRLPVFNYYNSGRVGFFFSSISFVIGYVVYLTLQRLKGERFALYSVDMDSFSHAFLRLLGVPYFCEMHGIKAPTKVARFFFNKVTGTIAINSLIKESFIDTFGLASQRILVEPNGVDTELFARVISKADARSQLQVPQDKPIVLYVGRGYAWKGLNILAKAAQQMPETLFYVVGTDRKELEQFAEVQHIPSNMICVGERPYTEVPTWLQAADVLTVLGTKQNDSSYKYTSPMKLFEYMAARKPVVASRTPAVEEILSEREAFLYEPDDVDSLVASLRLALQDTKAGAARAQAAVVRVECYTWSARAERILAFLTDLVDNASRKN